MKNKKSKIPVEILKERLSTEPNIKLKDLAKEANVSEAYLCNLRKGIYTQSLTTIGDKGIAKSMEEALFRVYALYMNRLKVQIENKGIESLSSEDKRTIRELSVSVLNNQTKITSTVMQTVNIGEDDDFN